MWSSGVSTNFLLRPSSIENGFHFFRFRLVLSLQCDGVVDDSESYFWRVRTDFLRRFVTIDAIWVHYDAPKSNWESVQWTAASKCPPKCPKSQQGLRRLYLGMRMKFCLSTTVTWPNSCVWRRKSRKNGHIWRKEKVVFHQENAPCHMSTKMYELQFKLLSHHYIRQTWLPATFIGSQTKRHRNIGEGLLKGCWWMKTNFAKKYLNFN